MSHSNRVEMMPGNPGDDFKIAKMSLDSIPVWLVISGSEWPSAESYSGKSDPQHVFEAVKHAADNRQIRLGFLKENGKAYFRAMADSCDFTGCYIQSDP